MQSVGIKLALECPTGLLRTVNPLGDFDYISIDQFLDDKSYSLYYLDKLRSLTYLSTRKSFTFGPVGHDDILKAWIALDGECSIIGPDTYNDCMATLDAYEYLLKWLTNKVIGVVQGRTLLEAFACLDEYGELVALPFDVASPLDASCETKMANRAIMVDRCRDRRVHLLGITSLEELGWYRRLSCVESLNTGLPIRLGLEGRSIVDYGKEKARDSRQYMDMYSQKMPGEDKLKLVLENIQKVKEVLNG